MFHEGAAAREGFAGLLRLVVEPPVIQQVAVLTADGFLRPPCILLRRALATLAMDYSCRALVST